MANFDLYLEVGGWAEKHSAVKIPIHTGSPNTEEPPRARTRGGQFRQF